MHAFVHHPVRRWAAFLAAALWAGLAWPQAGQTIPFVEPGGLLQPGLTRSAVLARLGPPPVTREHYAAHDPALVGSGALVLEYPEQGLAFVLPPVERSRADPRVAYMVVKSPSQARTPEGIGIGMHWSQVRARNPAGQFSDRGGWVAWTGSPGAGVRTARFELDSAAVVGAMQFDAGIAHHPPHKGLLEWLRKFGAWAVLLGLIVLAPWLLHGYLDRLRRRIEAYAPVSLGLGKAMLLLAPVLVVLGVVVAREGGAVGLLGFLMILGGAGMVLPAIWNLALGASPTPARLWVLVLVGLAVLTLGLVLR